MLLPRFMIVRTASRGWVGPAGGASTFEAAWPLISLLGVLPCWKHQLQVCLNVWVVSCAHYGCLGSTLWHIMMIIRRP